MRNFLLSTSLLLCLTSLSLGQDSTSSKVLRHSVGLVAGSTTGLGFGYKYLSPIKLGVQANYIPVKTSSEFNQVFGLTFSYDIITTDKSKLYLYQSNSLWQEKRLGYSYRYYDYNTDSYIETLVPDQSNNTWNHGIGFGMEFVSAERIGINVMTGYGAYSNWEFLTITAEIALFFKF